MVELVIRYLALFSPFDSHFHVETFPESLKNIELRIGKF